jgi:chromate transporter
VSAKARGGDELANGEQCTKAADRLCAQAHRRAEQQVAQSGDLSEECAPHDRAARLRELLGLFLKLGTTSFGGPAVHVAMMEEEVVRRRRWLDRQRFLDLLGATNLIPGPNSTELAIHIGHLRAGWPGLLVAGVSFILPAALMVTAIAWAYVRWGALPQAEHVFYGVKPVVIAVVVQALAGLARTALKSGFLAAVGAASLVACASGADELLVLFGAAALAVARLALERGAKDGVPRSTALASPLLAPAVSAAASAVPFGLGALFLFFLKVGSVLFGSGYVLLAFLRADVVERSGWLSDSQLLDAIAVGQLTPGPVFTTATFIGYVLGGPAAAVVATLGIFLPAFFFVAASAPLLPRMRRSRWAGALLDGVNVGSLALMAAVTLEIAHSAVRDLTTAVLAGVSALLLLRFRINSAWLVLVGGLVGAILAAPLRRP